MKSHHRWNVMLYIIVIFLFVGSPLSAATYTLTGKVYSGTTGVEPPYSTPLSGVTVTLWGANTSNSPLSPSIASTTTDGNGWYSLSVDPSVDAYDYYIIEERDPSGYYSVGATSVGGNPVSGNYNRIEYTYTELTSNTLSGNKFWDKPVRDLKVYGNSVFIKNGSTVPKSADGTDFGSAEITSGSVERTFTIENTGNSTLTINNVVITGTNSSEFTVTQMPSSTVAGSGGTTTFKVKFDPDGTGVRSAGINIINNSITKNPYDFAVEGTGTESTAPEINVQGENGLDIPDGDMSLTVADTDFGSADVSSETVAKSFFIQNIGTAALNLTGSTPYVTISGTHAADFSVTSTPSSSISSSSSTSFQITFDPSGTGTRTAILSIANDDSNENPYDFAVQGVGTEGGSGTGTLIVEKITDPVGDSQQFTFTGDVAGSIGDGGVLIVSGLQPGTYTTTEVVPSGWTLTGIILDPGCVQTGASTVTFTLTAGSTLKAIFENTKDPEEDEYDFGDAPDPTFPTLLVNDGARHKIVAGVYLGNQVDSETDGQQDQYGWGDDIDGSDDEDGIGWTYSFAPGEDGTLNVLNSTSGFLNAWIDFNDDGDWADPGEHIVTNESLAAGMNQVIISVPQDAVIGGSSFGRFRFDTQGGLSFDGAAEDGEVEDHRVAIEGLDFGDAPEPYPTMKADNGARHIGGNYIYLGNGVDTESDGQPDTDALGDDDDGTDDDDGVQFKTPLIPGTSATIEISNTITSIYYYVDAWIDFNRDGDWEDTGEHVLNNEIILYYGDHSFNINVPADANAGITYARFRAHESESGISYDGFVPTGEVEDYQVTIEESTGSEIRDYGDAPDPTYPTLAASNGARHGFDPDVYLGTAWDSEPDGQESANALGDDTDAEGDDEDGVSLGGPLLVGQTHTVTVTASINGLLSAWFDFNQDGDWSDADEQVFNDQAVTSGANTLSFSVPAGATPGEAYARFRYSQYSVASYTGYVKDGEVEDYLVTISSDTARLDFGDAPSDYPDASHSIGRTYFGTADPDEGKPDAESGMLYSADALGDDIDGYDDEEHIKIRINQNRKQWWSWRAKVVVPPDEWDYISLAYGVFIDWNQDGDWDDSGEQQHGSYGFGAYGKKWWIIGCGTNMPKDAKSGETYARFRLIKGSNWEKITAGGHLQGGEVCDFKVNVTTDGDQVSHKGYIWGSKWHDQNGDGIWDATEPGLAGWNIWLDLNQNGVEDAGDQYTTTDSDGDFSFIGIPGGTYTVGEDLQPGWVQTHPGTVTSPQTISVTVDTADSSPMGIFFGNKEEDEGDLYDFGDAPDPNYPTLLANNGARHLIDQNMYLGSIVDAESDGIPTTNADGDNSSGSKDEDGVMFSPFIAPGQSVTVTVIASAPGVVNGWIDFNRNDSWGDTEDHVIADEGVLAGVNTLTINVPAGAVKGQTYARFRFSSESGLSYTGEAADGEVEDYVLEIRDAEDGSITVIKEATPADNTVFDVDIHLIVTPGFGWSWVFLRDPLYNQFPITNPGNVDKLTENPVSGWTLKNITVTGDTDNGSTIDLSKGEVDIDFDEGEHIVVTFFNEKTGDDGSRDFGDAPSNYPSASHLLGGPYFYNPYGSAFDVPDAETGMQRNADATGDDTLDGNDDEEGLFQISKPLVRGKYGYILYNIHSPTGDPQTIGVWIDFNGDQDWDDPGEASQWSNSYGGYTGVGHPILVPPGAKLGQTFLRLRIVKGADNWMTPGGDLEEGEVEDYTVTILDDGDGLPEGGTIHGRKWNDLNGNGVPDAGEPALQNWTVYLDANNNGSLDAGEQSTSTDSHGHFMFTGLTAGTYTVAEVMQSGWTQTYPGGPSPHSVTVDPTAKVIPFIDFGNKEDGTAGDDRDFGDAPLNYPSASHLLGGPYFTNPYNSIPDVPDAETGMQRNTDATGDDTLDGNDDEEGMLLISGPLVRGKIGLITVYMHNPTGDPYTFAAWMDRNGDQDWDDPGEEHQWSANGGIFTTVGFSILIPPGTTFNKFYLRFRTVKGWQNWMTPDGDFGEGEVEDYAVAILDDGDGLPEGGIIHGRKWNDLNGNGVPDIGESGLPNWTIYLDANNNGSLDAGEKSTSTDSHGHFMFTGLTAGTYTVAEVMQPGWTQTYPGGPSSHSVTVDPTVKLIPSHDFGNKEDGTAGLGAIKWYQPTLFHEIIEMDTVCISGWRETSISQMPIVADDWFCYNPQPVTAIRWWGAYADWDTTFAPPNAPDQFHLGVWSDVPQDVDEVFSHPGEILHEWIVDRTDLGEYPVRAIYFPEIQDTLITGFEYTYDIPSTDWFYQEGDSTIYWLSIMAAYPTEPDSNHWGWITREHYFHDDAVRMMFPELPHLGSQFDAGDPLPPRWDMAFILATEQYDQHFDFGDAPPIGYATLHLNNGALHRIVPEVYMGDTVDEEEDGFHDDAAMGDDNNGLDDEDGVQFTETLTPGQENEVTVQVSTHGFVNAWLDIRGDGNWYEPEDYVLEDIETPPGQHTLFFFIPEDATPGETAMRFRFSREPHLWFNGFAIDGEVEDYMVTIGSASPVEKPDQEIPSEWMLFSNYPNPFNPSTQISFTLPERSEISLDIYNAQGAWVRTLTAGKKAAGRYTLAWDGRDGRGILVPSGVYLCRMKAPAYQRTIRMLFLK